MHARGEMLLRGSSGAAAEGQRVNGSNGSLRARDGDRTESPIGTERGHEVPSLGTRRCHTGGPACPYLMLNLRSPQDPIFFKTHVNHTRLNYTLHRFDDYSTTPNPAVNFGIWEGWGTSLCWWAAAFGDRSDVADAIFTLDADVSVGENRVPGLGLTIARYNAGASAPDQIIAEFGPVASSLVHVQGAHLVHVHGHHRGPFAARGGCSAACSTLARLRVQASSLRGRRRRRPLAS